MSGGAGYDPTLYELVHRGTPGDVEWYARALVGASRVLELGCGYGRVLSALAEILPAAELTGLDAHPGLLAQARARLPERVRLLEHDMREAPPLPPQDAVIAPYSTLWCLLSDEDALACFRAARSCLRPGGRFLFDAYAADGFHDAEPEPGDEDPSFVAEIHADERAYRVFERSSWRPEAQAFTVRYVHVPLDAGETIETTIEHRYLLAPRLVALLEEAGFAEVWLGDGFASEPWHEEADHLVGVARVDEAYAPP